MRSYSSINRGAMSIPQVHHRSGVPRDSGVGYGEGSTLRAKEGGRDVKVRQPGSNTLAPCQAGSMPRKSSTK